MKKVIEQKYTPSGESRVESLADFIFEAEEGRIFIHAGGNSFYEVHLHEPIARFVNEKENIVSSPEGVVLGGFSEEVKRRLPKYHNGELIGISCNAPGDNEAKFWLWKALGFFSFIAGITLARKSFFQLLENRDKSVSLVKDSSVVGKMDPFIGMTLSALSFRNTKSSEKCETSDFPEHHSKHHSKKLENEEASAEEDFLGEFHDEEEVLFSDPVREGLLAGRKVS